MRLWVLALALVAASGGCSGTDQQTSAGGTGGAGTGGADAGGGAGAGGGAAGRATAPYKADDPGFNETTDACGAYKAQSAVLAACQAVYNGNCPPDLDTALASIKPEELPLYSAPVGCGLTTVFEDLGLGGRLFTFDETGALVGYRLNDDLGWGPCGRPQYTNGTDIYSCADVKTCAIVAADAGPPRITCP